jgi:hypothetical protein
MPQDKAQSAVNGPSLNKDRNTGLGLVRASLRARRQAIVRVVAWLDEGAPHAWRPMAWRHVDITHKIETVH